MGPKLREICIEYDGKAYRNILKTEKFSGLRCDQLKAYGLSELDNIKNERVGERLVFTSSEGPFLMDDIRNILKLHAPRCANAYELTTIDKSLFKTNKIMIDFYKI